MHIYITNTHTNKYTHTHTHTHALSLLLGAAPFLVRLPRILTHNMAQSMPLIGKVNELTGDCVC